MNISPLKQVLNTHIINSPSPMYSLPSIHSKLSPTLPFIKVHKVVHHNTMVRPLPYNNYFICLPYINPLSISLLTKVPRPLLLQVPIIMFNLLLHNNLLSLNLLV